MRSYAYYTARTEETTSGPSFLVALEHRLVHRAHREAAHRPRGDADAIREAPASLTPESWSRAPGLCEEGTTVSDEEPLTREVFIAFRPNQPRNERSREAQRLQLRKQFEHRLEASVDRLWDLPPVMLQQPANEYISLLCEARELFIAGYFYACVAMCGIVGERLVKDTIRASVLVRRDGLAVRPTQVAFDQLERIDSSSLCRFLKETQLLNDSAVTAANKLGQLRNSYAHARGRNARGDAAEAIKLLHTLVEDTVSVFKDFGINNGALVLKDKPSKRRV